MTYRKVREWWSARGILLLLMGLTIVYLGAGFVRQASIRQQQRHALGQLESEIAAAQEENATLQQYLEFTQSQAAAEAWARENSWARPDEVSVVLVAPPGESTAEGSQGAEGPVAASTPQEAWWNLFFGRQ